MIKPVQRVYVNDQPVGMPHIIVCHFEHRNKILPAYRFDQGAGDDYFDEDGNSLRKAFSRHREFRISSRYNLKRFHPILNRTKPITARTTPPYWHPHFENHRRWSCDQVELHQRQRQIR